MKELKQHYCKYCYYFDDYNQNNKLSCNLNYWSNNIKIDVENGPHDKCPFLQKNALKSYNSIIKLRDYYSSHPLRYDETWEDFYNDFGYCCVRDILGYYHLFEDNTKSKAVVLMIPYVYQETVHIKISTEILYITEEYMDFIFHLMYFKLLYESKSRKILPAPKLNWNKDK